MAGTTQGWNDPNGMGMMGVLAFDTGTMTAAAAGTATATPDCNVRIYVKIK